MYIAYRVVKTKEKQKTEYTKEFQISRNRRIKHVHATEHVQLEQDAAKLKSSHFA